VGRKKIDDYLYPHWYSRPLEYLLLAWNRVYCFFMDHKMITKFNGGNPISFCDRCYRPKSGQDESF
jgi:hypothetical protein